ncbi:MAG: GlsB/YeaQ/YmgE family stress response membrane protein [Actinomycetota bacterium]
MDIGFGDILIYIVAGLIIGAIARLLVPGRQSMGLLATMIIGVVAAIIGGILWNAIFPHNSGIAWIGSIIVAVVLVFLYASVTNNSRSVT